MEPSAQAVRACLGMAQTQASILLKAEEALDKGSLIEEYNLLTHVAACFLCTVQKIKSEPLGLNHISLYPFVQVWGPL